MATTTEPTQSAQLPSTMRAFVTSGFGPPREVLSLSDDAAVPTPDATDVLVRVCAAATHAGDWHLIRGDPYVIRLMFGKVRVPGCEVAGEVVAVGSEVTRFQPGDRVLADVSEDGFGAFAEYVTVSETHAAKLTEEISYHTAAATATSAVAALQAIRQVGGVTADDHVLVTGASGGVGHFAVQMARNAGARVTGACRDSKADIVRKIGAHETVDSAALLQGSSANNADETKTFTVIIDSGCFQPPSHLISRLLKPGGRYVLVGGQTNFFFRTMFFAPIMQWRLGVKVGVLASKPTAEDLDKLVVMLTGKEITPHIYETFNFEQVVEAIESVEERKVIGKVVIDFL